MNFMFGGNVQNATSDTGIREPLHADNLIFVGLIAMDFDRQAKVCFEITPACAPVSVL